VICIGIKLCGVLTGPLIVNDESAETCGRFSRGSEELDTDAGPSALNIRTKQTLFKHDKMLSILRKARLKDKEMRILMLCVTSWFRLSCCTQANCSRGLDNAGKTTIVKKIMNEDVNSVSPTLGFIIKTIDYDGYVSSTVSRAGLTVQDTN
jgi:hypothetical protein